MAGVSWNKGAKKQENKNKMPQTTALNPVFAPSLIDADDSGDTKIGADENKPAITVKIPHMMKIQRPRGTVLSSRVKAAKLLKDVIKPFKYKMYKNAKSAVNKMLLLVKMVSKDA